MEYQDQHTVEAGEKSRALETPLDRELWNSIKCNDPNALTILFKRYHAQLYEYALKFSCQQDLAKDAVQEVFTYLWQKRESLSDPQFVKSYLYSAVRNYVLNVFEREKRHKAKHTEIQNILPKTSFSPEEMIVIQEMKENKAQIIKQALDEIPARQRETLYLKVFNELSYKEIAPILNITPQTARNHVSEAYQRLHKILSAAGFKAANSS